MLEVLQATPYTPIFPPPPPSPSSASAPSDSALAVGNKTSQKRFIESLKERYLLLSGLPEELCPPSREASPEAEARIESWTLRMRNARELRLPFDLVLTCVGVKGGDWVGVPVSDESQDERQYCLPATEEEWFEWESARTKERDDRRRESKAKECREKIEKWSQGVQEDPFLDNHQIPGVLQGRSHPAAHAFGYLDLADHDREDHFITTRIPSEGCAIQPLREQSEPVERNSSPPPFALAPDLLPDFCNSFSPPGSVHSPRDPKQKSPTPDDLPQSPSFAVEDIYTSTPVKKRKFNSEPILQLSSPISPPRSLRPLAASQTSMIPTSLKRACSDDLHADDLAHGVNQASSTPHSLKRARTMVQPITPKSVERPRGSQELNCGQDPKRLPTLDDLLDRSSRQASSRKGTPRRRLQGKAIGTSRKSSSPQRSPSLPLPEVFSSQPSYSKFRPQFQSTQCRRSSLPPSPSQPLTSTQRLTPKKMPRGTASSGIGSFQSQFDVERRIHKVAAFLDADAWEVDT